MTNYPQPGRQGPFVAPPSPHPSSGNSRKQGGSASMEMLFLLFMVLGNLVWVPFAYDRWGVSIGALFLFGGIGELGILIGSALLAFVTSLVISARRRRARQPQENPEKAAAVPKPPNDPETVWKNLVFSTSRAIGIGILVALLILGLVTYLAGMLPLAIGFAALAILAVPLVAVVPKALRDAALVVPQQEVWIVYRLGKYVRVLRPGPRLLIPWIEEVIKRQDMRWNRMEITANRTPTRDKIAVDVPGILLWKRSDQHPEWSFLRVQDIEMSLPSTAEVALRQTASSLTVEDLLEASPRTIERLNKIMMDMVRAWGVQFLLRISDTILSPELEAAISAEKRAHYEASAKRIRADAEGYVMQQLKAALQAQFPKASEQWLGEAALDLKALDVVQATGQAGGTVNILPLGDLLSRRRAEYQPPQGRAAPKEGGEST